MFSSEKMGCGKDDSSINTCLCDELFVARWNVASFGTADTKESGKLSNTSFHTHVKQLKYIEAISTMKMNNGA